MSQFRDLHTHYCEPNDGAYNSCHIHDVIEPETLDEIVDHLERSNVLYIKGRRYVMDEVLMTSSDGHIYCRLAPDSGVWELADLSQATVDVSQRPF